MEREGRAGSYIARFKKTLHSWFSYNGLDVRLRVNVRGEHETPTIANERVPGKEELDRILRMVTPRARVSIALMAFSGLRSQSLGNYVGTDGIRLGDFVEAEVNEEGITFTKVPAMLVVRRVAYKREVRLIYNVITTAYLREALSKLKRYLCSSSGDKLIIVLKLYMCN
ncbi:MAG: hypothetical protein QXG61_05675 [Candidatus Nezhaarchaeales archaeon]